MTPEISKGEKLLAFLASRRSDGSYRFDQRDAKDLFCLMVLSCRLKADQVPSYFQQLLGEFMLKIGFNGTGGRTISQAVDAYFQIRALDPTLVAGFRQWVKEELGIAAQDPLALKFVMRG